MTATLLFANKTTSFQEIGSSNLASIKHELLTQRRGYEAISSHTLNVYSIDHIVEPDTTMVLKVSTCDNCGDVTWVIKPTEVRGSVSYDTTTISSTIHAVFKEANTKFSIKAYLDGHLILDETAACKYVRRELRSINTEDRDRFMVALKELYSIDQKEGEAKYGKNFLSYQHLVALHASKDYSYHGT
mmetsp:Transcript_54581/g.70158  ORF Transcript_54581/g.70158 Transcript_54581/m.70158 type:complete len:187 (-) Transcript_54581:37-597(-)